MCFKTCILSLQCNKEKELFSLSIINQYPSRERGLKIKKMMTRKNEDSLRTLAMLRYQANRYQLVGNGSMSQRINAKIRRLMSELEANVVEN